MNKSEFNDIVSNIIQSRRKVNEQEAKDNLCKSNNVLLIVSVKKQFEKIVTFLQTPERKSHIFIWCKEERREITQALDQSTVSYINHEGNFSVESAEFMEIKKERYDMIVFCVDTIDRYSDLNLEYVCRELSYNNAIIYSFDCVEQFTQYNDIENHIEYIEKYKKIFDKLN